MGRKVGEHLPTYLPTSFFCFSTRPKPASKQAGKLFVYLHSCIHYALLKLTDSDCGSNAPKCPSVLSALVSVRKLCAIIINNLVREHIRETSIPAIDPWIDRCLSMGLCLSVKN